MRHFLTLPLEIRLQIYTYVLQASPATVTFGSAQLTGSRSDIEDRLYNEGRSPWESLPQDHIPVIEPRYDQTLLLSTQVPAKGRRRPEELGICDYTPRPPLLLVCKQIHAEIMDNISADRRRELSILSMFISYPEGLHVYHSVGTHLLAGAQTVQIAGTYTNDAFSAARAAKVSESHKTAYSEQLAQLISSFLGPTPKVAQLQLRIYYPGPDSYSTVWGDDDSPIVVAVRNIWLGDVHIEVWRGAQGTGVSLMARPRPDHRRTAATTWHRLGDDVSDWVISESWPDTTWKVQDDAEVGTQPGRAIFTSDEIMG